MLMAAFALAFILAMLPGLALFYYRRGPRMNVTPASEPPELPLAEAAVLRDGAMGATRWAFAALLVKLVRDGHCTIVRERKRRWVRAEPALTVDLHADPTALSPLEQTVLRQLGRHDTLGSFGFAGSTFRRRTLRDVRADLVERGWLADRRWQSNACWMVGAVLVGLGTVGALSGGSGMTAPAGIGLGVGSVLAAYPRYPLTGDGARRRAAHRACAERQRDRLRRQLSNQPERAWKPLLKALPHLVLERLAPPRWLIAVAGRFETAAVEEHPLEWIRDEVDGSSSRAKACWTLACVLRAMGARAPSERLGREGIARGLRS
jgi:uncharacterized protein (TIGR04222 family)